uniref:Uncharacterized protein n=1 Tax=Aegilops tauschii TaxID=37682 RepID=M8B8B5_AEGTA
MDEEQEKTNGDAMLTPTARPWCTALAATLSGAEDASAFGLDSAPPGGPEASQGGSSRRGLPASWFAAATYAGSHGHPAASNAWHEDPIKRDGGALRSRPAAGRSGAWSRPPRGCSAVPQAASSA